MIVISSVDLSGARDVFLALQAALINDGQDADMPTLVRDEARRTAMRAAAIVPPKNRSRLNARIDRDIGRVFTTGFQGNINEGKGGMRWTLASSGFLFGIKPEYDLRSGGADMVQVLRQNRKSLPKRMTTQIGRRGKQRVFQVNRFLVHKGQFNSLRSYVRSRVGRMKATFALSASKLGQSGIPAWVSKHFGSIQDVSVFRESTGATPSVEFGSRAPGVTRSASILQAALRGTLAAMKNRTKLILSGYARDVAQGLRPRKHAKETQGAG